MEQKIYAYSYDNERYFGEYDSVEDALRDAYHDCWSERCPTVYIGECYRDYEPHFSAEYLLELLEQDAYDNCGECVEDWLWGVPREAVNELDVSINNIIKTWLSKHGYEPTWFSVENEVAYDYYDYKKKLED